MPGAVDEEHEELVDLPLEAHLEEPLEERLIEQVRVGDSNARYSARQAQLQGRMCPWQVPGDPPRP
jgi:hypothetical protein